MKQLRAPNLYHCCGLSPPLVQETETTDSADLDASGSAGTEGQDLINGINRLSDWICIIYYLESEQTKVRDFDFYTPPISHGF